MDNCNNIEAVFTFDGSAGVGGGEGVTDHSQLTGRDIQDQHPVEAITGLSNELTNLNERITTLEGNDDDLGQQVQNIQVDVNALKTVKPVTTDNSATQALAGALDVKGQLDIIGVNNESIQIGFQDEHAYINSNKPLNVHPDTHFQKSPTVSDTTSYALANSQSLVRKQQVEEAVANMATDGTVDSKIATHNLNNQSHNDIRNQVTELSAELDNTVADVAALQADVTTLKNAAAGSGSSTSFMEKYGIEADYCIHYGILDCPNGLIDYNVSGFTVTVNSGIVIRCPGGETEKTKIASEFSYDIESKGKITLFLAQGSILEAGDVYYQETEPDNGVENFLAWWKPSLGKWQFKSNDTGNVWREAVATPVANVNVGAEGILSINYIGYRILDDDIIAQQTEIESLHELINNLQDRITALENK